GKEVPVICELVRINHHRNCVLCHAPAVANNVPRAVPVAEVSIPNVSVPAPRVVYGSVHPSNSDILVRLDVTYLRQDFSLMLPDADPAPKMQRFDFLVRTRVLTDSEAARFPAPKADVQSPYHIATREALRQLADRHRADGK